MASVFLGRTRWPRGSPLYYLHVCRIYSCADLFSYPLQMSGSFVGTLYYHTILLVELNKKTTVN